jgi:hypothetical protein
VRGVNGASWNNKRLAGVRFSFQISKHAVERHTDDPRHVLKKQPTGPDTLDNSEHIRPAVTVIRKAAALPGTRERLTGEAPADEIDVFELTAVHLPYVAVPDDERPVGRKHPLAILVDLHLAHARHTGTLKAKRKPSDTREQIKEIHDYFFFFPVWSAICGDSRLSPSCVKVSFVFGASKDLTPYLNFQPPF